MNLLRSILVLLALAMGSAQAAESTAVVTKRDTVSLVSDTDAVAAGTPYHVGLRFRIAPGWHTYGRDPGEAGLPPELAWTLPDGTHVGEIAWPAPERMQEGPVTVYGYTGELLLPVVATGPGPVRLHASWLICSNICVPEEGDFSLALPVGAPAPSAEAGLFQLSAPPPPATASLWALLGFALLGGLVLNLMPCVFPVLAMKAMAIARASIDGRRAARAHAAGYTVGVVASFSAIGGVLVALRSAGHVVGWGFQFQSPVFVAAMAWVLFGVGLNLSGVFHVSSRLAGAGQGLTLRQDWLGSLFSGVLAVLVATPCTAPFMSVALAAALTAPPVEVLGLFFALGLGLAAPAAALAILPGAARLLPRPGAWMEVLKQALAFPMYAACAWLVWVVSLQSGGDGVLAVAAGLVAVGFAGWVLRFRRLGAVLAAVACLGAVALLPGLAADPAPAQTASAEHFSASRLASLRAEGRPVFVNLTASWCVTCLVNERVALSPASVRDAFSRLGVTVLVGDWTRADPEITAFLQAQGRDGVPLYLYYPPGHGKEKVLPQVLTPSEVLGALAG